MRCLLPALGLLLLASAPAEAGSRNFGVSGFDRVRVQGPYKVRLFTGVAPFARASGSIAALDAVVMEVVGRTLVIRRNRSTWGGYPGQPEGQVEISIGTHELTGAVLTGTGSLAIDKVKGLSFDLVVEGSGAAAIGDARVDQLKLAAAGSGGITVAGASPKLTAIVRGVSSLDASALTVKDATLGAEGTVTVRATVTNSAKVDAQGTAAVALHGRPSCNVRAIGSATVTGCR